MTLGLLPSQQPPHRRLCLAGCIPAFCAALAVLFYHLTYTTFLGPVSKYGYLGVDLFFMISGFVILWSAQGATAREFIVSRFARLYPAFWLCMGFTIAGLWIIKDELPTLRQVAGNATMLGGYTGQEYIDGVYWTLQVELKFYVLILGLILIRQMRNVEWWLMGWLVACILDAVVQLPGAVRSLIIAPYGPLFIAGCLFYLIRADGFKATRIGALTACAVLAAGHAIPSSEGYLFGEKSYVPAFIVLALFGLMAAVAAKLISVKPSAALATLSALTYPLYLIHNELGRALVPLVGTSMAIGSVMLLAYVANAIDRPVARYVKQILTGKRGADIATARAAYEPHT